MEAAYRPDVFWLERAIDSALQSGPDVPVGATLVAACDPALSILQRRQAGLSTPGGELSSTLVAAGHNEREAAGDPTGHAEVLVLRRGASLLGTWRLNGTTLYSTLEPCAMCAEAAIQARVDRIVFGAYDPINGACGSAFNLFAQTRRGYPVPEVVGGILEERCRDLLLSYFKKERRR